jgi:hypothetical protein
MKHSYLLSLIILFLSSCAGKESKTNAGGGPTRIEVNFDNVYEKRKFPQPVSSVTIQKLKDCPDIPIGQIDKVIVDHERIYILDRSKSKALFIYSREGEFLDIIHSVGSGPGEFTAPHGFDIDEKSGNIIIMDSNGRKIIIYSSTGDYIKEFKYDFIAVDFILDSENNLIFNTGYFPSKDGENFLLVKTDMEGRILDRFFPADNLSPSLAAFNPRHSLQKCDGELFFLPTFSNCIYGLNTDGPQTIYEIDFGNHWPAEEFFEKSDGMHPLKVREQLIGSEYVCFLNFIQTKDVLHLDFHKGKNYSFYYNKNTKQSLLLPMEDKSISFPVGVSYDQFIFVSYWDTGEPFLVFYAVDFNI